MLLTEEVGVDLLEQEYDEESVEVSYRQDLDLLRQVSQRQFVEYEPECLSEVGWGASVRLSILEGCTGNYRDRQVEAHKYVSCFDTTNASSLAG